MQTDNFNTTEYRKLLRQFHSLSDRHVLVIETNMSNQVKYRIFHDSELLRKAGNELTAIMQTNYHQMLRTKKYRKLKELYGKYSEKKNSKRKDIAKQMSEMQQQYNVTWDFCRTSMVPIGKKYGINSIFALTKAEDIWSGIEKCLYGNGNDIHFSKHGNYSSIRAKQINRGIVLDVKDNSIVLKYDGFSFGVIEKDKFHNDETKAIVDYMQQPEIIDDNAVNVLIEDGVCIDTYRPCYVTLVPQIIRNKLRVFAHITIEGKAKPKYDKHENLRHNYGNGNVGCDIGTQTIAYTSKSEVGLKNLAERGTSISDRERQERLLYRKMDRSRRATNPDNYNPDGTIKKGKKTWKYSNRYKKLKAKHSELCRINAINRRLAINEDVNHIRSLGNIFITEPKNADRLKKKVKNTTKTENGKYKRKKRFGKSIQNRCPGYFQMQVKKKFEITGGLYYEVASNYRASQYDHTADDYIKKKLNQRIYRLADGTKVQRDWYSSYLLYCFDNIKQEIDKNKCNKEFKMLHNKEKALIEWIKTNNIKVLNSGIKLA